MVKRWTENDGLTLLNREEICEGKYTFCNEKGGKSPIGHILENENMLLKCKRMTINEEKQIINFKDNNLATWELRLKPMIRGVNSRREMIILYKKIRPPLIVLLET